MAMMMEGKGLKVTKVSERLRAPVQPNAISRHSLRLVLHASPPTLTLIATQPTPFPQGPCSPFSSPSLIRPAEATGSFKPHRADSGNVTSTRHLLPHVVHVVHRPSQVGTTSDRSPPQQGRNTVGFLLEGPRIQDYPRDGRCTESFAISTVWDGTGGLEFSCS